MSAVTTGEAPGMTRSVWLFTGCVVAACLLLVLLFWNSDPFIADYEQVSVLADEPPLGSAARAATARAPADPAGAPSDTASTAAESEDGYRTQGLVREAVEAWDGPGRCRKQLKDGPAGDVMLTFTIEPAGDVSSVIFWRLDDGRAETFASCLQKRASSINFPTFEDRVVATARLVY